MTQNQGHLTTAQRTSLMQFEATQAQHRTRSASRKNVDSCRSERSAINPTIGGLCFLRAVKADALIACPPKSTKVFGMKNTHKKLSGYYFTCGHQVTGIVRHYLAVSASPVLSKCSL